VIRMDIEMRSLVSREDRFKVELTRGQRGGYGWTVTVYASDEVDCLTQVERLDRRLQAAYATNSEV